MKKELTDRIEILLAFSAVLESLEFDVKWRKENYGEDSVEYTSYVHVYNKILDLTKTV